MEAPAGLASGEVLLVGTQMAAPLLCARLAHRKRASSLCVSSYMDTNPVGSGTLMTSLNYLHIGPTPNTATLGDRASIYEF